MSNLILPGDIHGVTEKNSIPVASSRYVAQVFNKRHDHILRDVQNIINDLPKSGEMSSDFSRRNFTPSSYKDNGRKYPEYLMTRDGFTLLAMGFTGKKAMSFKISYINRFNEMESFIRNLLEAKADFPEFTQAIMDQHEEPKHYHFSNELDMINRIVLGMSTKQFKEENNLVKVSSIRPYLTPGQAEAVKILQRIDIGLIVGIPDYHKRKKILTDQYTSRTIKSIA